MKPSRFIFIVVSGFILLGAYSCTKGSSLKEYPIANIIANAKEMSLDNLNAKIEHIQLETTQESLVADIMDLVMTQEYIFILTSTPKVLQFAQDGEFIREISMQGSGPGEYNYAYSLFVNEQNQSLYLNQMYGKILEFDFDGVFKGAHKETASMSKFIFDSENNLLESILPLMGSETTKLQVVKLDGDTLARFDNHVKFKYVQGASGLSYSHYKPLFHYQNKIIYHQISTDTVFTYDPQSSKLEPRYCFNNPGGPDQNDYTNFIKRAKELTLIYDVSEDSNNIYVTIVTPGWKRNVYMIDKVSGEYYLLNLAISNDSERTFLPKWQYKELLIDYVSKEETNPEIVTLRVTGV